MEKVKTGIKKLDEILRGGFPKSSFVLLAGGPGTGKTILSAKFLYSGAVDYGERGMYVSFAENHEEFNHYMLSFGWDFNELERRGLFTFIDFASTSEEALENILKTIVEKASFMKVSRLVIDSLTALSISVGEKYKVRNIVYLLKQLLKQTKCTTLLIAEVPIGQTLVGTGIEEFVVDGIIFLELRQEGYEFKRRLVVLKMRGTEHDMSYYRLEINSREGVEILPLVEVGWKGT
jgi:circadian clock protein KaiC